MRAAFPIYALSVNRESPCPVLCRPLQEKSLFLPWLSEEKELASQRKRSQIWDDLSTLVQTNRGINTSLARELRAKTKQANDGEGGGKEQENSDFGKDIAGRDAAKDQRQIRIHRPGGRGTVAQGS